MKLSNTERNSIINDIIDDIHNKDFRCNLKKTDKYWYKYDKDEKENINLEWLEHKELDMSSIILLTCSVIISLYIAFTSNNVDMLVSVMVSTLLICPLILFDYSIIRYYLCSKISDRYKSELGIMLNKYIDVLESELEKDNMLDTDLYNISLTDYLDKKYVLVGNREMLFRLINKIKETTPRLIKVLVTDQNADVIIIKNKSDIPDINIKNESIAVEYHIDNGVFCMGMSDENTDIVKICIDNGDIEVLDDCGLNVLVNKN